MTRTIYSVQRQLPGREDWWEVCACLGPDQAAEVVRVLLRALDRDLRALRIDIREVIDAQG